MDDSAYQFLFSALAFILGAVVGSFLNVCIYRLPRDLSVNRPRRSFCPVCKAEIPWSQNLPLISWLTLRGRCATCGSKIAFRYFGVELLTALLFLAIWRIFPWEIAIAYWIFVSLLIVATFVDLEHFIIPDQITIGGTIAGIIASFAVPELMNADSRVAAGIRSLLAAALGYVILWIVLQGGKVAFGKKSFVPRKSCQFSWVRRSEQTERGEEHNADLIVGDISWKSEPAVSMWQSLRRLFLRLLAWLRLRKLSEPDRGESWIWSEIFARESDVLTMKCDQVEVDGKEFGQATLTFTYDQLTIVNETWELDKVNRITGIVSSLVVPREAMGRGDLKFLAAIGAFLGWRGVLFSIFAGSVLGSVVGLITLLVGKRVWSAKLPFGPYLAVSALIWMFFGETFVRWYLGLLNPL